MTEDEVRQQIAKRDAHTIRYTEDGRRVSKRCARFRPPSRRPMSPLL